MTDTNKKAIAAPGKRVRVCRKHFERLLKITTIQEIETAPTQQDEDGLGILAHSDSGWIECFFDGDDGEWVDLDGNTLNNVTHWLPLPRFTAKDFQTI